MGQRSKKEKSSHTESQSTQRKICFVLKRKENLYVFVSVYSAALATEGSGREAILIIAVSSFFRISNFDILAIPALRIGRTYLRPPRELGGG